MPSYSYNITDLAQLREIYPEAKGRAKQKQLAALEKHSMRFIELSPFVVMSTSDISGKLDASPRGGRPGFVKVRDENMILLPDAAGNNRLDSLENILATGQVGLLFMIPGVDETLRLNGQATIRRDPELIEMFSDEPKIPISILQVSVEEVFLHCAKAFMRANLWSSEAQLERDKLPTMGQMLKEQLNSEQPAESQEDMLKRYRTLIE